MYVPGPHSKRSKLILFLMLIIIFVVIALTVFATLRPCLQDIRLLFMPDRFSEYSTKTLWSLCVYTKSRKLYCCFQRG